MENLCWTWRYESGTSSLTDTWSRRKGLLGFHRYGYWIARNIYKFLLTSFSETESLERSAEQANLRENNNNDRWKKPGLSTCLRWQSLAGWHDKLSAEVTLRQRGYGVMTRFSQLKRWCAIETRELFCCRVKELAGELSWFVGNTLGSALFGRDGWQRYWCGG